VHHQVSSLSSWTFLVHLTCSADEQLPPDSVSPDLLMSNTPEGVAMPNVNDDVMSVVDAYFQAWTSGDIEGALSYLSDDARCYAPEESIANKDDWRNFMQTFI